MLHIAETPNRNALKFITDDAIPLRDQDSSYHFYKDRNDEAGIMSPVAKQLFTIDGITEVFIANDFVTVTKDDSADWQYLKPLVIGIIIENIAHEVLFVIDNNCTSNDNDLHGTDDEILIKSILNTHVRPFIARDGGDVQFIQYEEGVLTLKMIGACSGCPSSIFTLKFGIENMLKQQIPSLKEVVAEGIEFDESELDFLQ